MDFEKMLESLAKMDKKELEEKIKQAQTILKSKDIDTSKINK